MEIFEIIAEGFLEIIFGKYFIYILIIVLIISGYFSFDYFINNL